MNLKIHRGTHEIGGSCVELSTAHSRLVIDIGMPLVTPTGERFDMAKYKDMSGPELVAKGVLPDIKGFYKWDDGNKLIDGLLISHPHMDHYGFFDYVHPEVPFYIGEAAKKIIDITVLFTPMKGTINKPSYWKSGKKIAIGDFVVTPFLVDHAAFDSYAFSIKADGKTIIYSGDLRDHGRKTQATRFFISKAPRQADALLLEGTMLGRPSGACKSEDDLEQEFLSVIKNAPGAVLFYCSAQNIDRLVTVFRATRRAGKLFVIDFYTAKILRALKDTNRLPYPSSEFKEIRVFYPSRLTRHIADHVDKGLLYPFTRYKIDKSQIGMDAARIVMLVRPSMVNDLERIPELEGAQLIYSLWEGYLADETTKRLLAYAERTGMKVHHIHTSGHASHQTLQHIVDELRPKNLIPIHTFNPEKYGEFGVPVVRLKDGQRYRV